MIDGQVEHLEDAPVVREGRTFGNQYHLGCPDGPSREHVTGGTYLIVGADVSRSDSRSASPIVGRVVVTRAANRQFVAELVAAAASQLFSSEALKVVGEKYNLPVRASGFGGMMIYSPPRAL